MDATSVRKLAHGQARANDPRVALVTASLRGGAHGGAIEGGAGVTASLRGGAHGGAIEGQALESSSDTIAFLPGRVFR
eukprot:1099000-Prymnesium_polylepis.2